MNNYKESLLSPLQLRHSSQNETEVDYRKLAAWFIGPKGENGEIFSDLVKKYVDAYGKHRKEYYKSEDQEYITEEIKNSTEYREAIDIVDNAISELFERLEKSVPFYSPRYQAHMLWDTVIPANLGYITAMLFNQNNVASEASPVTCQLEYEVGLQLCNMLGFGKKESTTKPWGHITSDGSIANLEAMWAARNMKFYPIALKELFHNLIECIDLLDSYIERLDATKKNRIKEELSKLNVILPNNEQKNFMLCTEWELLNLDSDTVLKLRDAVNEILSQKLNTLIEPYLIQNKGFLYYARKYPNLNTPKIFVTSTCHYSWPKSATVLGMGTESVEKISVDEYCRMDTNELKIALDKCAKSHIPVIMVTAVLGSTEEGAVDNVEEILKLRDMYRNGREEDNTLLNFHLHCDGAWGGYMASMLDIPISHSNKAATKYVPYLPLSKYAITQYENIGYADTITVDPHKAGFIPYPAGSLCYRNSCLKDMIYFDASYIHSSGDESKKIGVYGIEGSKPGAAPAAVWAAHRAIPLNHTGYGHILSECTFSTKIYYCYWATLATDQDDFDIQMLIPFPDKIYDENNIEFLQGENDIKNFIRNNIIGKTNEEIAENSKAMELLRQVGSDVLITPFIVNFKKNSIMNKDITKLNKLNEVLFRKFSITDVMEDINKVDYMLMYSTLNTQTYEKPLKHIADKWDLSNINGGINCLITTVMNPWPTTCNFITTIMNIFREGLIDSIKNMDL